LGSRSGPDASAGTRDTPGPSAPPGAATPGAAGGPVAPPSEDAGRQPSAAAAPSAAATRPAAAGGLRATYTTSKPSLVGLLGYQGRITVTNPTSAPIGSWTVVLELTGNNKVTDSDGAVYMRRDGQYWFIPAGAGTVAPGGTYVFTFDVTGVLTGPPVSCTIDDQPCG
jgi:chitinase